MLASHYASIIFLRGYLDAQAKVRDIASAITKNTKNVSAKEKEINAYKRAKTNEINAGKLDMNSCFMQNVMSEDAFKNCLGENGQLDFKKMAENGLSQEYGKMWSQYQAVMQETIQQQLAALEQEVEFLNDQELEPLKQLGEDLQVDKNNAELEVETTKAAYEATKKMAQENTKNMWA